MTVQELIDKLQQIEDKSLNVVTHDGEFGFCHIEDTPIRKVPNLFDADPDDIVYVDAVLISADYEKTRQL